MLPPTMSQSMVQSTASPCSGLSTSGPSGNITDDDDQSLTDQSSQIANATWIYMGPVIFFVGLIGNILILIVMSCKRMRGTSTSDYLIIMAVADLLTIITCMIPEWLEAMGIFVLQNWNPPMCKIYKFLSYATGDTATWIRVLFTLDRFMAICFPMKKTDCCLAWKAKYYCLGAAFAAIAKNLHLFWTRGAQYDTKPVYEYVDCVLVPTNRTNTTLTTNCGYPTPAYQYFELYIRPWIAFALVNFIPFCIILVCNIFIIRAMIHMTRMRKEQHMAQKTGDWQLFQTTAMCLGASFAFLFCVTPTMVTLIGKPYWTLNGTNIAYEIAKAVSNQLLYLNNSINFFLYCVTGKKFRETLKLILRCHCKDLMTKSDVSASRVHTLRQGSVAAGVNGARGQLNSRQNSKIDNYTRQTSGQSVRFDLQVIGERTDIDKVEENVVVNGKTTAVHRKETIVVDDIVITELVENVGDLRNKADLTLNHKRSGSESSSGVSSNGEQSPATLSSVDVDGNGSQRITRSSTNQSFADDQRSTKDKCQAEGQGCTREQWNVGEQFNTKLSCSCGKHYSDESHCSSGNKDTNVEAQGLTHDNIITCDHNLTSDPSLKDIGLVKNDSVVKDCCLEITQYSDVAHTGRNNSSVLEQTNSPVSESCKDFSTSSMLAKDKTILNAASLKAVNSESPVFLNTMCKDSESGENASRPNLEGVNNDIDKIETDNSCSIGTLCGNEDDYGVNSDAENVSGEKLDRVTSIEDTVSGSEFHGTRRRYRKDELLDKLPESIC